jgi:hypothetical protein
MKSSWDWITTTRRVLKAKRAVTAGNHKSEVARPELGLSPPVGAYDKLEKYREGAR